MINGIIETESLADKGILNDLAPIKTVTEYHPDSTTSLIWHINLIAISKVKYNKIKNRISKNILNDWYAIFWDNNLFYVIFKNKIFTIPKKYSNKELREIKIYGLKHGVQEKYLVLNQEELFEKYLKT